MAKKKKKASSAVKTPAASAGHGSSEAGTIFLWVAAMSGALFLLAFLAVPWINVLASGKGGFTLISDALKAGNGPVAAALLFALVPAGAAMALPFLAGHPLVREGVATAAAIAAAVESVVLVILTSSTRNLLAVGGGRQTFISEVYLLHFALVGVVVGGIGYLVQKDIADEADAGGVAWYGVFVAVLVAILYFNYAVIPDSLIPPPEFVRQRMGW